MRPSKVREPVLGAASGKKVQVVNTVPAQGVKSPTLTAERVDFHLTSKILM
jgi:hypothetical protein